MAARYNTRSHCPEWRYIGDWTGWRDFTDRASAFLREEVAKRFTLPNGTPLHFGRDAWHDAIQVILFDAEVDPFIEWLESLPPWDGVDRLDGWLSDCFTVKPDDLELADWSSRFILLGAVWRAYRPGTKMDEMPVLIGKGGIGKSTALRVVLPPEMPTLFTDGLNLSADSKTRAEALQRMEDEQWHRTRNLSTWGARLRPSSLSGDHRKVAPRI